MAWFNKKKLFRWMSGWFVVFSLLAALSYINAPEGREALLSNPGVELSIWVFIYILSSLTGLLLYVVFRAVDLFLSSLFRKSPRRSGVNGRMD